MGGIIGGQTKISRVSFTNDMVLDIDVFNPAMEFKILDKTQGTLVVSE